MRTSAFNRSNTNGPLFGGWGNSNNSNNNNNNNNTAFNSSFSSTNSNSNSQNNSSSAWTSLFNNTNNNGANNGRTQSAFSFGNNSRSTNNNNAFNNNKNNNNNMINNNRNNNNNNQNIANIQRPANGSEKQTYAERLHAIYQKNGQNKDIQTLINKYSQSVAQLHGLYVKVCNKYSENIQPIFVANNKSNNSNSNNNNNNNNNKNNNSNDNSKGIFKSLFSSNSIGSSSSQQIEGFPNNNNNNNNNANANSSGLQRRSAFGNKNKNDNNNSNSNGGQNTALSKEQELARNLMNAGQSKVQSFDNKSFSLFGNKNKNQNQNQNQQEENNGKPQNGNNSKASVVQLKGYSASLTAQEIHAFKAKSFQLNGIPLHPPTKALA